MKASSIIIPLKTRALAALLCLGVLSIMPAPVAADTRPIDLFELGAPSFTTFSTHDGVPDSVIVSIRTDREGFVWLGSQHGLVRYDGKHWSKLDDPVLNTYVDDLFLDHDGTLWATSRTFGLARLVKDKHWQIVAARSGLTSNHVRRLVETTNTQGRIQLWALTWDAGLFRYRNGRWLADPGNSQLPNVPFLALALTHTINGHERLWLGTGNRGLWYREDGGRWQPFRHPDFTPNQIEHLYTTQHKGHEALWISGFGSGLYRLDANGLRVWSEEAGDLPSNELYNITETTMPDGGHVIWVASRSGLVRIYHDRARTFDRRYGLPSNAIRNLSKWRSPNGTDVLWLATESGVARMIAGANQWKTASLMGARGTGVFDVLIEPDGHGSDRLWVASMGDGLGLYEQGRWRYFNQANGLLPDSNVRMVKRADDQQGMSTLWLSLGHGSLLRETKGSRFRIVPTPWPHTSGQSVSDMLSRQFDGQREQWFATRSSGLYRLRDGNWTQQRPQRIAGQQWSTVKLLNQTLANGQSWLWATSNQGLARFDGKQWSLLGRESGLPGTELLGMSLIADEKEHPVLWIGSTHYGIIRLDVSNPLHPHVLLDSLPLPPDSTAYGALSDSSGRIYVCTNAGVQQLTPSRQGYSSRVFTRSDGMVHDECNINAQLIDTHDRYWTGTLGGLAVYDPKREIDDQHAKPLKLSKAEIDGKAVAADRIIVASGHHDLRVEYALLSWQHESDSRFRTQLVGYETAPGKWTAQNFRNFGTLPAGNYVLRIEGRDYAGNTSKPIELPIHVVPAWWQRGWIRVLLLLAVLCAIYLLIRWRTRALQHRQRQLDARIAIHTAELNDANERLLKLSYQDALTGLANRRRLLETLEYKDGKQFAKTPAALIFVDVDMFKEFNDTYGHPAGDEALRNVANAMRGCAPANAIVARYGGEEFACLLFDTDLVKARTLAEQIRRTVATCPVPIPGTTDIEYITISAGVAYLNLDFPVTMHKLLRDADIALYQAKNAGRNCVRG